MKISQFMVSEIISAVIFLKWGISIILRSSRTSSIALVCVVWELYTVLIQSFWTDRSGQTV